MQSFKVAATQLMSQYQDLVHNLATHRQTYTRVRLDPRLALRKQRPETYRELTEPLKGT